MALELTTDSPTLVDPFGGAVDLLTRTLRTPAGAGGQLQRRPVAHAARGPVHRPPAAPRPMPELVEAVSAMHGRLEIVSAERIRDELDKLITLPHPTAGLWFAIDTGLADEFLPELPAMRLEQDPIHRHKDVLTHTLAVVENVRPPAEQPAAAARRSTSAAPAWPRCSTTSASRAPAATRRARASRSTTTTRSGARMTRKRLEALRYSNDDVAGDHRAGRPAPALPHLLDGLDRLGRASLRARRRARCSAN